MGNKKTIIVLILAAILAFITAFVIFLINKPINSIQDINENLIDTNKQEETIIEDIVPAQESLKEEILETKTEVKSVVKQSLVQKPVQKAQPKTTVTTPQIKPIKVEASVEDARDIEKTEKDNGVIKEANSGVVVITREFKTETPAKYSFK